MPRVLEYFEGNNGHPRKVGEEGAVSGGVFNYSIYEEDGPEPGRYYACPLISSTGRCWYAFFHPWRLISSISVLPCSSEATLPVGIFNDIVCVQAYDRTFRD
jgi:hypothetical protein